MDKTNQGNTTPGGSPVYLENPPSSEAGPTDSGGDQLLLSTNTKKSITSPDSEQMDLENTFTEKGTQKPRAECNNNKVKTVNNNNNKLDDNPKTKMIQTTIYKSLLNSRPRSNSTSTTFPNSTPKPSNEVTKENLTHKWQSYSRKRNRNSPEETARKQAKPGYWLNPQQESPITTQNRFKILQQDTSNEQSSEKNNNNPPKPPPIFVAGVKNINPLSTLLNSVANKDFQLKVLNDEQVKIQALSPTSFSTIVKNLEENKTEFHTYKPKTERNFRVVVKNLHYSTDPKEIEEEINQYGHQVANVWNIKNRTKVPLPMFMIDLKPNTNNSDIYKIKTLLQCIVKIEAPLRKKEIPQCINCQRYGHTKSYCHHSPRCVKCAGTHHTSKCTRNERSKDVKCVLCEGNHPANYKGCVVYKDLQRNHFPSIRKKILPVKSNSDTPSSKKQGITSYAKITQSNKPNQQENKRNTVYSNYNENLENNSSDIEDLKNMMKELMDKMSIMLSLLSTLVNKIPLWPPNSK